VSESGWRAVDVLVDRYSDVVASLTAAEWEMPSRCAGWSVKDLVAHASSNLHVVVEPETSPADPPPIAEDLQELLVVQRRGWTADQVVEEFEQYREPFLAAITAVQQEPLASSPLTMSELGTYPMHQLADAFAFDLWCHLYVDLLAPTGPIQRPVPEPEEDLLQPAIGWMLAGLPQMCPSVSKVLDRPMGLDLTGPGGGRWILDPGEPYFTVREEATDAPRVVDVSAVATSSAVEFVLWGTARSSWRDHVVLDGDTGYAERVLDEVNIV
jgi:uncharacterized protein (TIGR03083 family)